MTEVLPGRGHAALTTDPRSREAAYVGINYRAPGPVPEGGTSFAVYSEGRPERFDEVVAPDYVDYGHTPPGHGPQGARDDYENAVKFAACRIHALRADDHTAPAGPRLRRFGGLGRRAGS